MADHPTTMIPADYLGDGVYVEIERSGMFALRVGSHTTPPAVYLEPEVLAALVGYARRAGMELSNG